MIFLYSPPHQTPKITRLLTYVEHTAAEWGHHCLVPQHLLCNQANGGPRQEPIQRLVPVVVDRTETEPQYGHPCSARPVHLLPAFYLLLAQVAHCVEDATRARVSEEKVGREDPLHVT